MSPRRRARPPLGLALSSWEPPARARAPCPPPRTRRVQQPPWAAHRAWPLARACRRETHPAALPAQETTGRGRRTSAALRGCSSPLRPPAAGGSGRQQDGPPAVLRHGVVGCIEDTMLHHESSLLRAGGGLRINIRVSAGSSATPPHLQRRRREAHEGRPALRPLAAEGCHVFNQHRLAAELQRQPDHLHEQEIVNVVRLCRRPDAGDALAGRAGGQQVRDAASCLQEPLQQSGGACRRGAPPRGSPRKNRMHSGQNHSRRGAGGRRRAIRTSGRPHHKNNQRRWPSPGEGEGGRLCDCGTNRTGPGDALVASDAVAEAVEAAGSSWASGRASSREANRRCTHPKLQPGIYAGSSWER